MTPAEIAARCANDPAFFAEVTLKIAEAMQDQEDILADGFSRLTDGDANVICRHAIDLQAGCFGLVVALLNVARRA